MKVVIGDMEYHGEDLALTGLDRYSPKSIMQEHDERRHAQMKDFLVVAEKCYIERYGLKPERSTSDEF